MEELLCISKHDLVMTYSGDTQKKGGNGQGTRESFRGN